MVSLIIFLMLLFGFFIGLKRGFILQLFHLIGFIASFAIATMYYGKLSPVLALWVPYPELSGDSSWAGFLQSLPLEKGFYNAISFAIIFFAVKIALQIIASMLDFVAELPILRQFNKLFGMILGFLEVYLLIFIILFILALTPLTTVQAMINDSFLALLIIEHTPFLSSKLMDLWLTNVESLFDGVL